MRIICQDYATSFTDLIAKDNFLTIHHGNLQKLIIEMSKVKAGMALEIMRKISQIEKKPYNIRHKVSIKSCKVKSVNYGTHVGPFAGPRIWDTIPSDF